MSLLERATAEVQQGVFLPGKKGRSPGFLCIQARS
jgi:hypothetical protein